MQKLSHDWIKTSGQLEMTGTAWLILSYEKNQIAWGKMISSITMAFLLAVFFLFLFQSIDSKFNCRPYLIKISIHKSSLDFCYALKNKLRTFEDFYF